MGRRRRLERRRLEIEENKVEERISGKEERERAKVRSKSKKR